MAGMITCFGIKDYELVKIEKTLSEEIEKHGLTLAVNDKEKIVYIEPEN
jgi:hypothetical protein